MTPQRSAVCPSREKLIGDCEVALAALLADENKAFLRFITQSLKLPATWLTVVGQALLDKDRLGNYRWKQARNPIGLLRTMARRIAGKTHPELLNFLHQTSLHSPSMLPLSQLSQGAVSSLMRTDRDSTNSVSPQEVIERYSFDLVEFDDSSITEFIHEDLRDDDISSALDYDWDSIGRRMGLSEEQTILLNAKAGGVTRTDAGAVLGWDQVRVERVWRALSRLLENPTTAALAREALLK